jgi:hypothetical protein
VKVLPLVVGSRGRTQRRPIAFAALLINSSAFDPRPSSATFDVVASPSHSTV